MQAPTEVGYFSQKGRRELTASYRVFDKEFLDYYHIKNKTFDYESIFENYQTVDYLAAGIDLEKFKATAVSLKAKFSNNKVYAGLFNGVHVPFVVPKLASGKSDLAQVLVEDNLPYVEASFKKRYPMARFKAVMQGGSSLKGNLKLSKHSRYGEFINAASSGPIVGWYFPQALQQFDIDSQISQMQELPDEPGVCLSGPAEVFSAVIGKPDLLINEDGYSPILCMSAVEHTDERLALVLKAYGPHMEFWCLSQMLVPGVKQVSEQWAGGISIYQTVD